MKEIRVRVRVRIRVRVRVRLGPHLDLGELEADEARVGDAGQTALLVRVRVRVRVRARARVRAELQPRLG